MSILSRLLGKRPDEREALRPVWQNVVTVARARGWYASCGVADTKEGRFDMVSLVLAAVLLRMEHEPDLAEAQARLTELFVEDMDGQLRQSGIGDPTVGKHVRKLVTTLGGRLGALRDALPGGLEALVPVLERNVTMRDGTDPVPLAQAVAALVTALGDTQIPALLAGQFSFEPA
ncbi:MAG: ubiquinol-cytochrome C chaperone family protein [Novosphingobium sp.]|nr:ubiquinol-cytochrome C chaperone family protein [Novosphingobium sp.]